MELHTSRLKKESNEEKQHRAQMREAVLCENLTFGPMKSLRYHELRNY